MLQKTPAERVARVFPSFIKKYRSCRDILRGEKDSLEEWFQRLGLKKRAEWILETCKTVETTYGGIFPTSAGTLRTLKGCGEYCSRTIVITIKGTGKLPMDSNLRRLLTRIFGINSLKRARDFWISKAAFYGLLDIAAEICLPRKPSCRKCPLRQICRYGSTEVV